MTPVLENGHFVARKVVADFLVSAKLGDTLDVKTKLVEMRRASFILNQTIYKDDGVSSGRKKLFEMQITLAYISFEGRPQKMQEPTINLILSLFDSE